MACMGIRGWQSPVYPGISIYEAQTSPTFRGTRSGSDHDGAIFSKNSNLVPEAVRRKDFAYYEFMRQATYPDTSSLAR